MEPKTKQNAVVSAKKVEETQKSKVVNSRRGTCVRPAKIVSRVLPPPLPPQPPRKVLFKEGGKSVSVSNKKGGLKQGRVVASRYNDYSEAKKRSLPESNNGSEVVNMKARVVASSYNKSSEVRKRALPESNNGYGSEVVRLKKRWEIPSPSQVVNWIRTLLRVVVMIMRVHEILVLQKRVVELTGARSYF
ncbi:uncharacterized protein LOC133307579 [Gastrolobium bilobum]|uniref:uncharacterized protein LOC133307579 n=1 Tax=Gastrolobium bilobum TaxID=150636 RepID=UPI002AB01E4D|nr:uncharacterized protein LOC133307579 [Gastrolobium bilobum]